MLGVARTFCNQPTPPNMKTTAQNLIAVLILTFSQQNLLAAEISAADTSPFVASIGQHTLIAGLEIEVFVAPEGLLGYKATLNKKSAGPAKASIHKNSSWFIYAASSHDIWAYDGANSISRIQFTDTETKFQDSHAVPDLLSKAPQKFRDHLPESFRNNK